MRAWDRLVQRAAEQHGYVTTRDARDLDIDPTQLRLMAARGGLEHVGRGDCRVPMLSRGEHDHLAAAVAPEAQVDGRKFDAACRAAERRLSQIEQA
jgi:predicted transcriptional regulator of viral defense system